MKRSVLHAKNVRVAIALIAGVVLLTAAPRKSWADQIDTFRIALDGVALTNAAAYELKSEGKNKHTLRVTLSVTDSTQLARFEAGQTLGTATIEVLSLTLVLVATYRLSGVLIESVQNVATSSNVFT